MYDLIVIWRVLDACNLACRFCEFSILNKFPRVFPDEKEILRVAEILHQYKHRTGSKILVSWLGGEPLLWQGIFRVSNYLKRDLGLHISSTTNGTFLDREDVRKQLVEYFDELTISVDGLGNTHDFLRGKEGLFTRVLEGIAALSDEKWRSNSNLKLRANVMLDSESIGDFENLCAILARHGITHVTFNPLMADKKSPLYRDYGLKPEHLNALREIERRRGEIFNKYGLIVCGSHRYFERVGNYVMDVKMPVRDCQPGTRVLFIDQHGGIGPCSFLAASTGVRTTDLRTVEDIEELPSKFREFIKSNKPLPCEDCHDTNVFGKFEEPEGASSQSLSGQKSHRYPIDLSVRASGCE